VSAADGVHPCFREAEVRDLAGGNEVLHRSGDLLHRHVRVHTVLIEQIDALHTQPAQRVLDRRPDVLRPAVQPGAAAAVEGEPELGGDDRLLAHGSQSLADELLVAEGAVHLRGVEEGDA
jgi:hypothetical protein